MWLCSVLDGRILLMTYCVVSGVDRQLRSQSACYDDVVHFFQ